MKYLDREKGIVEVSDLDDPSNLRIVEQKGYDLIANIDIKNLMERADKLEQFRSLLTKILVDGVDKGVIEMKDGKSSLPTLFYGGAQKIKTLLGLTVKPEVVNDWQRVETGEDKRPLFMYRIRCYVYKDDVYLGQAEGTCSTEEGKFAKMGAFAAANNVLKVAYKRAYVSAVRDACGLADMFSVDLDDNEQINKQKVDKTGNADGKVNKNQIKDICARFGVWGLNPEEQQTVLSQFGVGDIKELPADKVAAVLVAGRTLFEKKKKEKTGND